MAGIYDTLRWRAVRARALKRDQHRCTVSRLLGGSCSQGSLHAHHIVPVSQGGDPYDVDNVGTTCASHHPLWEALRRRLVRELLAPIDDRPVRCRHQHRTAEGRRICEARLNRSRETVAA